VNTNVSKRTICATLLVALTATSLAVGQYTPAPTEISAPSQKTLASTMDVYVFPTKGQSSSQQSEDEATCYNWAVQNTGTDPFQLQKQTQQQQQQTSAQQEQITKAGTGAGAKGAVGGAAAGALIGEIAGHSASAYAWYGAAAGALIARRRSRMARSTASAEVQQQGQQQAQASQEQMGNFKKAFSVCLEAKNYMVKY
jgi:hypothetical protein